MAVMETFEAGAFTERPNERTASLGIEPTSERRRRDDGPLGPRAITVGKSCAEQYLSRTV